MTDAISIIYAELNKVLDVTPLKHLQRLRYDKDKTRLIQRPDQHF